MTSEDFIAWMRVMGERKGKERLSEREAATMLGWSREPIRRVLAGADAPLYIGLACTALAAGRTAWRAKPSRRE